MHAPRCVIVEVHLKYHANSLQTPNISSRGEKNWFLKDVFLLKQVVKEGNTGSVTSSKVKLTLTIEVQRVDFDSESCTLHLAGVNVEENPHVRLGAYHTVHLELQRDFTVEKDCWDVVCLERLDEAIDPVRAAEVAAISMETGLAHLCLISGSMTVTRAKLEVSIPKKRAGASNHGKAVSRFYAQLHAAVSRHVDFGQIKCILVGSPGFVAADFLREMFAEAVRTNERAIIENRSKFVVCRASSGHKRAIAEMLGTPEISSQLLETRVVEDVRAFARFTAMLQDDADRAYYGYNHVVAADANLAVDTLMVTDTLFKSCDVATRKKYVALTESVRAHGGVVRVFSSLHVSGEQLAQVSGIAAVLRFPMPEEVVVAEDAADSDSDSDDHGFGEGGVFTLQSGSGAGAAGGDSSPWEYGI